MGDSIKKRNKDLIKFFKLLRSNPSIIIEDYEFKLIDTGNVSIISKINDYNNIMPLNSAYEFYLSLA